MTAHNSIKRDKRIVIMVTEEERNRIKGIASRTAYKTLSNFCREMIFQICDQVEDKQTDEYTIIEMAVQNEC